MTTLFTREKFANPGDDAGVFIEGLARALVTWCAMQDVHPVTVSMAAKAFNTTEEIICEAVEDASWIYEENGTLMLDGA